MASQIRRDFSARGDAAKKPSPLGTTIFVGLRSLDVFLQYSILTTHLASPLLDTVGIPHISSFASPAPYAIALGLPLKPLIILGMAAGTAFKQIYWVTSLSNEEMPVQTALMVAAANTVSNSVNTILSLTAASGFLTGTSYWESPTALSPLFIASTITYIGGALVELTSEIQRRNFKADKKNKGKPYTEGLFGVARHINLGAYTVLRTSYALACGGWIAGLVVGGLFGYDFVTRAVPLLDDYCGERYGEDWKAYKEKVTYKLIPGVY